MVGCLGLCCGGRRRLVPVVLGGVTKIVARATTFDKTPDLRQLLAHFRYRRAMQVLTSRVV
jgi:NaMN:DMB phosphoribosyltransferase